MEAKDDANHKRDAERKKNEVGKKEQYQLHRVATTNHRKQRGKRRTNHKTISSTTGGKHIQDVPANNNNNDASETNEETIELRLDEECSFPTLTTPSTPATIVASSNNNLVNDEETTWKNECLATKIATSLELEAQQEMQRQVEQLQKMGEQDIVQLTTLSSKSLHTIIDQEIDGDDKLTSTIEDNEEISMPHTATSIEGASSQNQSTIIPNTKQKWTESELSKMRKRWWEAVRAKQKKAEEDRVQRMLEFQQENALLVHERDSDENEDDSSSLGRSNSSSPSSSSISTDNITELDHANYHDPMEPPSLTTPFDEMVPVTEPRPPSPTIIPYIRPTVPQSILDLEQRCIQSMYPLHCAIYNIALSQNYEEFGTYNNNNDSYEKSDAEVVLHRLLTKHKAEEVMQWKSQRVGLSRIPGLEGTSKCDKSSIDTLTNAKVDLLSADIASLTPVQLAIYWNQPKAIRLLYSTTTHGTNMKHSDEEDEHGRTPLMLACELSHAECIQALMCASSLRKLDRRERKGGNTAFHFCCMGSNYGNLLRVHSGDDDDVEGEDILDLGSDTSTSVCVDSLDMLLRYTSVKDQKRALMTTNRNGHNLLHLACLQGDLILLECLLKNIPGVNVSKVLDVKDVFGYTPFLTAVAHNS